MFFNQLLTACTTDYDVSEKYDILRTVFRQSVDLAVRDNTIAFGSFFAKVDYCLKEHNVPYSIANLIHQARKEIFPRANGNTPPDAATLDAAFVHNLKATALLVHYLSDNAPIRDDLRSYFPKADRHASWGRFDENALRVIVERWDDNFIWATSENDNTTVCICYGEANTYLSSGGKGDWSYLNNILWKGAQLNIVRIRKDTTDDSIYMPELIILEPDYLVNITTIAGCFETYAESPFVNLIAKIKPSANSLPIHLGNLSGQFLDETVHGSTNTFEESLNTFIGKNALSMISCPELIRNYDDFKKEARCQKENIERLIGKDLEEEIGNFDMKDVVLEPSFFSEILGIQGRIDFLHEKDGEVTIIEQKSGKGEFVSFRAPGYNPDIPRSKEPHVVQLLLYRALFIYEFGMYSSALNHVMLLYSKYARGLVNEAPRPELFLRAMRMRNLLTWCEFHYAKEGFGLLATLTPEKLNKKQISGRLWNEFVRPQLSELLTPIATATPLERAYYLRFMQFIANEQLLSKVGNKTKEASGFASIWNDTLEEKRTAGSIYDRLHIELPDNASAEQATNEVSEIIALLSSDDMATDSSNFRIGDIVIVYPYNYNDTTLQPNACAQMVHRASIIDISEGRIRLRLRNSQTDRKVFENWPSDTLWAIEHDLFDSASGTLYSAMHSFLSAPKSRRDLLLSQRMPETDATLRRMGEYGAFNTLIDRAVQAKELFLIIGPPGTGKTSFGLVNLLNEELLRGTNILLMSYTNRAVDEICSKLVEIEGLDFLRIGSDLSCSPEYRKYLLSTRASALGSANEVNKLIRNTRVFCATTAALNANMSLLSLKEFSLAIIDEASQILEPHIVGLLSAQSGDTCRIAKFVLIGDHKQLPAVVQQTQQESVVTQPELNAINLTDCRGSLFQRLLSRFKTPDGYDERYVYMLTNQGRMHHDIAEFPNLSFYEGKLDVVPLAHQLLPNEAVESDDSIVRMLTSSRLSFVDVRPERRPTTSLKTNIAEARRIAATVYQIYLMNKDHFDCESTVGVIVPYRNQISTVRNEIDRYGVELLHDITIDTVERYQGSQRDYILYGFTVQQPYQLQFLTDSTFEEDGCVIDRKLNVAMTRARLNLVLFGNVELLSQVPTFSSLITFIRERGNLTV